MDKITHLFVVVMLGITMFIFFEWFFLWIVDAEWAFALSVAVAIGVCVMLDRYLTANFVAIDDAPRKKKPYERQQAKRDEEDEGGVNVMWVAVGVVLFFIIGMRALSYYMERRAMEKFQPYIEKKLKEMEQPNPVQFTLPKIERADEE